MDNKKVIDWVNTNLKFREEYARIFGHAAPYGNLPCPWHQGTHANTPAAKIYGNRLKCFGSCGCSYGVYRLLRDFDPGRIVEIKQSGVIGEEAFSFAGSVRRVDVEDVDVTGLVCGSFEFYAKIGKI